MGHQGLTPLALNHAMEMAELAPKLKPVSPSGMSQTEATRCFAEGYGAVVTKMPTKHWLTQSNRINWRDTMLRAEVRKSGANDINAKM